MRFLIRSILALVFLAALGFAALLLVPAERVARIATDAFTERTGRGMTIEGPVRATLWPRLGVTTGPVTIANADWSDQGPMLRAEGLDLQIDMASVLGGAVRITGVTLTDPRVMLERAADGQANWSFGGGEANNEAAAGAEVSGPRSVTLDLAQVTGGALSYVDHGTDTRMALTDMAGTLMVSGPDKTADITFDAAINGQTVNVSAEIAQFEPLVAGRVADVSVDATFGEARVVFAGRAGINPPQADGSVTATLGDLAAISRLAGIARPDLPEGLGASVVTLAGDLTVTSGGSLHLRAGTATLDDTRLTLDADLTTDGPRPKLSAQVVAGAVQIGSAAGDAGAGGGTTTPQDGWSSAPIDVSALAAMDASIALSADSIGIGRVTLGDTRIMMTLDRSRAVFDLRQVTAYQGRLTGQFVVNGRGGLSLGGDLRAAGIAAQPLLRDMVGYDRLIGTGDLALKFLAVGNSTDALMRGLSGSGSLNFGRGELRGLDLAGMLRNLDPGYIGDGQRTIFDGLGASFTIEAGTLDNRDLVLSAPYVTATGAGKVGIANRTFDYRLLPTALAAVDGTGGFAVPLLITGTWAQPKFRLDLEGLAKDRLEAEAKEVEARAKAALEARAARELGVERQDGESLEDAAKRRAQEALDDETQRLLRRLLGGE